MTSQPALQPPPFLTSIRLPPHRLEIDEVGRHAHHQPSAAAIAPELEEAPIPIPLDLNLQMQQCL